MRILIPYFFSTGYFLPEFERIAGGAELGIYLNIRQWTLMGHQVNLMSYHPTRRGHVDVDGVRLWLIPGTPVRTGSGQRGSVVYPRVWEIMGQARPDVFYQTGAGLTTGLFRWMCAMRGIPSVLRLANDRDVSPELRELLGPWRHRVYLSGLRGSTVRIAQTRLQQDLLHQRFGLDSERVPNCKEICGKRSSEARRDVVWVARAMPAKRPYLFLSLVRHHPEQSFVMVAPGYGDRYEAELHQEAAKLPNLRLLPKLGFDEVQQLFASAKLLVSTSCFEGFPNTFLEASLQETPILSLQIDPDGYLTRHRAGMVVDSEEALGPALGDILANPALGEEMGRCGRRAVEEEYDVEKVARRYLDAFRLAVDRKHGRR